MGYISSLFNDPIGTLIFLLLAMPGRLMAISVHEFAHAWMANRCGDPTAKMLGRLTLNPLKHIDIIGVIMMAIAGFGWAKPVPVNPRNFRNFRRDDLKVSIAGVTTNFIMFVLSACVMYAVINLAFSRIPAVSVSQFNAGGSEMMLTTYNGVKYLYIPGYYPIELSYLLKNAPYIHDILITPVFGSVAGYAFQMLSYFVQVNLVLAVFNLLPIPPLDGYHVLNDLILKRDLFASPRAAQISTGIMLVLVVSGVLGRALGFVIDGVFNGAGVLFGALMGV